MRKILMTLAAVLCCAMTTSVFTACKDDENTPQETQTKPAEQTEVWKTCEKLTFISGLEGEDPVFQKVIRQRFPNQTGSLSEAEIAFVSHATAAAHLSELKDFYKRGGLIVMMRPDDHQFDLLGDDYLSEDDDEDFSDNDQLNELFFAYNKDEKHYTMYKTPKFDGVYDVEVPQYIDYDQNEDYLQTRLDSFIDFIEEIEQQTRSMGTRSGDDMTLAVEDGYFFTKDIPLQLYNFIADEDWVWHKASSITIKYWVSSAYLLKCNGMDKAGDYYLVKSEIIPHIRPLWEVKACDQLASQCRIYAYWFDNMEVYYYLCYDNDIIVNNVVYYKHPVPENENTQYSYSKGFSWGINGSIGGEVGGSEGRKGQGSVGFSLQWESSTSYTVPSIKYTLDTQTTNPHFTYTAKNVTLTDADITDTSKTDENFPEILHTEFSAKTAWMWHVRPQNGVADNANTRFKLYVWVKPQVASWYHWRGALEYDSNKRTYDCYHKEGDSGPWATKDPFCHGELLPAPNRTSWGILKIKNAANNTMANIKVYNQDDYKAYKKNGSKIKEVATIPSSYNVNETAETKLTEGTYAITFQTIDPNRNNKELADWEYEEISIHQGKDASSATTEISTVNAVMTRDRQTP